MLKITDILIATLPNMSMDYADIDVYSFFPR